MTVHRLQILKKIQTEVLRRPLARWPAKAPLPKPSNSLPFLIKPPNEKTPRHPRPGHPLHRSCGDCPADFPFRHFTPPKRESDPFDRGPSPGYCRPRLDTTGQFGLALPTLPADFYNLTGLGDVYLAPGDSLAVDTALVFTGRGALDNNLLQESRKVASGFPFIGTTGPVPLADQLAPDDVFVPASGV